MDTAQVIWLWNVSLHKLEFYYTIYKEFLKMRKHTTTLLYDIKISIILSGDSQKVR